MGGVFQCEVSRRVKAVEKYSRRPKATQKPKEKKGKKSQHNSSISEVDQKKRKPTDITKRRVSRPADFSIKIRGKRGGKKM